MKPRTCSHVELTNMVDIWFHRYEGNRDIEGKCKYRRHINRVPLPPGSNLPQSTTTPGKKQIKVGSSPRLWTKTPS